jgi:mannose-1-phosphate guanylyltransferase
VKAVILVGGEGSRLRPLTTWLPKSVLPIAGRPFIGYMLEWLRSHGVDEAIMSCGYLAASISELLGDEQAGVRLRYVVEREPLGTGGAIEHAARELDETFVVCNGDVLTDLDLSGLVALHRERGARATIALQRVEDPSRYGLVRTAPDGEVLAFIEKPPPGRHDVDTINAGTYVLEPDVLELVPRDRMVSVEREVFPKLVGAGLYAQPGRSRWRDIGTVESYLEANLEEMPAGGLVDERATVAPSARVSDSVVGANARIGERARVQRSIVLAGGQVGEGASIAHAIVGPHAAVEPGSVLEGGIAW